MQDKIDCNKINEIREERIQTQFLYWFDKVIAYIQYSSNPLEIFHSLCKNLFTKSEPHRDNPSLVFRNPYNLRDSQSPNQSLWMRRKKQEFSLEEKDITIEVHGETLNGFASVCLSFFWESIWQWSSLEISLSYILCPKSPIYRPWMTIQKSLEQIWLSEVIFWRVVTLGSYFLNFWILDLDQTWETLIFGIIKIMYTYIHIFPLFNDENQVIYFRHHQNNAWSTFSPFFMITLIIQAWSFLHHQNFHDLHKSK